MHRLEAIGAVRRHRQEGRCHWFDPSRRIWLEPKHSTTLPVSGAWPRTDPPPVAAASVIVTLA